jgi:hypothetical protein
VASSLTLGGRRAEVKRPRVRSIDGHELTLPSWQTWSSRDPLHERVVEQMVLGVSSRRYARSLEPVPEELRINGGEQKRGQPAVGGGHRRQAGRADGA